MSNLLRCFGFTENRLHLGQTQTYRFGLALGLHCFSSLELSHVLQYAPSFSLSAPCILLTLTPSFCCLLAFFCPYRRTDDQMHNGSDDTENGDFDG